MFAAHSVRSQFNPQPSFVGDVVQPMAELVGSHLTERAVGLMNTKTLEGGRGSATTGQKVGDLLFMMFTLNPDVRIGTRFTIMLGGITGHSVHGVNAV